MSYFWSSWSAAGSSTCKHANTEHGNRNGTGEEIVLSLFTVVPYVEFCNLKSVSVSVSVKLENFPTWTWTCTYLNWTLNSLASLMNVPMTHCFLLRNVPNVGFRTYRNFTIFIVGAKKLIPCFTFCTVNEFPTKSWKITKTHGNGNDKNEGAALQWVIEIELEHLEPCWTHCYLTMWLSWTPWI